MRYVRLFPVLLVGSGLFSTPSSAGAQLPAPAVSSSQPLHLGGYGSLAFGYSRVDGDSRSSDLTEAAAAVLFSGTLRNRLSYFGELDLASRGSENWTGRQDDRTLEVERLYGEYFFSDALRLRVGRFLTPVGQWNERHAEPLTWTTLRPLTTYRAFAKSSTGFLVAGETMLGSREVGYTAYVAPPSLTRTTAEESAFISAFGSRVALEVIPGTYVGASAVAFRGSRPDDREDLEGEVSGSGEDAREGREEDRTKRALIGLDFLTRFQGAELRGEAVWLSASDTASAQRGAFVQGAIPLVSTLYGVLRVETYDPVVTEPLWTYTLGLTWRAYRRLVLKVDRQITDRRSVRVPDGWFFSISSLF